ncbi:MAG: M28 family metallopeptidase, partial [Chloroflexota bacterium]|nr:M28 family metallopeptidase [Chloroflexota bacterium]
QYTWSVPYAGALVVTDDPARLGRTATLSSIDANARPMFSRQSAGDRPILWISEETADRLLHNVGSSLAEARRMQATLETDSVDTLPLDATVSMSVDGSIQERVPVRHVIGHLPGDIDAFDHQMIVVLAQYDNPPPNPDGGPYPGANDNASGVAVMLEAIHTMQETDYQPYKTFLFIAYSGEGQEGGEWVEPIDVEEFLQAKYGFAGTFDIEAVIHLRGLGAGEGGGPLFEAGGNLRLAQVFETASHRMDTDAQRAAEAMDVSVVFEERGGSGRTSEAPTIYLYWNGWEDTSRTPADTLDTISAEKLERSGEWLAHALMILGRDTQQ